MENEAPVCPCKECIVLAMCIRVSRREMFSLINILAKRCSLLYDYLTLADTDIKFPEMDAYQKEKDKFNAIQHPRIIEVAKYMRWDSEFLKYLTYFDLPKN